MSDQSARHECETMLARVIAMERDIEHVREVMKLTFVTNDRERLLSVAETNRRLDLLNGEAGRLVKMQDTYVPRETYETYRGNIDKELRELRDFKNNSQGRQAVIAVIVSIATSLGFFILSWLVKSK